MKKYDMIDCGKTQVKTLDENGNVIIIEDVGFELVDGIGKVIDLEEAFEKYKKGKYIQVEKEDE